MLIDYWKKGKKWMTYKSADFWETVRIVKGYSFGSNIRKKRSAIILGASKNASRWAFFEQKKIRLNMERSN